jgi:hypothetical protein
MLLVWLCRYATMHGQQNIKFPTVTFVHTKFSNLKFCIKSRRGICDCLLGLKIFQISARLLFSTYLLMWLTGSHACVVTALMWVTGLWRPIDCSFERQLRQRCGKRYAGARDMTALSNLASICVALGLNAVPILNVGWRVWFILCSLQQRFPNCGPRTTGGPRVLPLWSS